MMEFLGDLPLAFVLDEIRAPNDFFVVHLNHRSSSIVMRNPSTIPELWD
jgi:hypothetical protein